VWRSGLYYEAAPETAENLRLMRLLDEQYTRTPFYGVRKMVWWLDEQGYPVNPKRVRRLMRLMGLEAIYAKPRLSLPAPGHKIYPYLLRDLTISRPDQAWCSDITFIRLRGGFIYLVAVMDWFSRYVLAWEVSVSLETSFCVSALNWALECGRPDIFRPVGGSRHRHQHGRTWTRDGQHFHRTFVEDGEVRRDLFERLLGRAGSDGEFENLLWFLQSRAPSSGIGLSNTGCDLLPGSEENAVRMNSRHAESRSGSRTSSINDRGANYFATGKSNLDKERKRTKKKERFGRGGLWKLPQRWKSIKVAFGNFLLMISTAA
jgi:hypothetical protein